MAVNPQALKRTPSAAGRLRRAATRLGIVTLVGAALLSHLAAAAAEPLKVSLQCRLGQGPWQPCRMQIEDVGMRWELRIGNRRIGFRHTGDGAVHMRLSQGDWRPVSAHWQADATLCWDGVCARGDIPLD